MTRTLILIRHAKSDWDDAALDDHDRPLNERGRASAPRIGAWLARLGVRPDGALVSTARRTQETWDGLSAHLPGAPHPTFDRALYLATPEELLSAIRDCDARCLAVLAHNPGIGALAWSLSETPPEHQKFGLYPTGATLVLDFDADHFAHVGPGRGQVRAFAVPRELPDPHPA